MSNRFPQTNKQTFELNLAEDLSLASQRHFKARKQLLRIELVNARSGLLDQPQRYWQAVVSNTLREINELSALLNP